MAGTSWRLCAFDVSYKIDFVLDPGKNGSNLIGWSTPKYDECLVPKVRTFFPICWKSLAECMYRMYVCMYVVRPGSTKIVPGRDHVKALKLNNNKIFGQRVWNVMKIWLLLLLLLLLLFSFRSKKGGYTIVHDRSHDKNFKWCLRKNTAFSSKNKQTCELSEA